MYLETVVLPPDFTQEGRKYESICHFHDNFILVNLRYVGYNTYFCKNYCFPQMYELIEDPDLSAEIATYSALEWYFSLSDNRRSILSLETADFLGFLSPPPSDGVTIDDLSKSNNIHQLFLNL